MYFQQRNISNEIKCGVPEYVCRHWDKPKIFHFSNLDSWICFLGLTSECGPGSVVGIATVYELDGLGIESRCRRDFLHLSRPALGPTQPPVQWVLLLSRG
jgi:hypothetical protein